MDPIVVLFGLGVGVLIGLTGIGGGSLMTPLLLIFVGTPPVTAIGTDLAYGAVTKTVGGWQHLRRGNVDLRLSWWMAAGSMPGSLLGVWLIERLHGAYGDSFDTVLLIIVAIALLVTAIATLGRTLFMPNAIARERESVDMTARRKVQAVLIGLVLGLVLGMTSVGSGALIGLALILVFQLIPHRVVGTDVFHAAILLWSAGIAHWVGGNVDFGLMGTILIGSLPGVWIGTALLPRVPATGLRPALGCVLLASALGVATKAGLDLPAYGIVGPPLLVGAIAFALQRRRSRLAAAAPPSPRPSSEVAPA